MSDFALEAKNLTFRYLEQNKKNVLQGVNIRFRAGKITVLMGSSGCGKSTLAALLAGLYPENGGVAVSGGIRLFDRPLEEYSIPERARSLSMMFQNPDLQFCMETLRKELFFCLGNLSCPTGQMEARVLDAAQKTGMSEYLDRPFCTLSGGEKQKAALSCIFLLGSRVILLDEPFANIDEKWAKAICEMLKRMNRELGTTLIVIDHALDYWLDCLDEIQVLSADGSVTAGITRENLPDYRDLFESQGLRWPYERTERRFSDQPVKTPALVLENLSVWAGKKKHKGPQVLRGADAVFGKHEMTAVLGPSGCGKTTLFRTLLAQQAYSGSVRIDGEELGSIRPKELFSKIGIVFQNPANQFVTQNVLEEVECGLVGRLVKRQELEGTETEQKAIELLGEFHLSRFRRYSPYMLSQGQQRRLAVLSILAGTQKILLLDEPTYGQDDAMTRQIMELLRCRMERDGLTVLFSSHDMRLVRNWADRVYVFSEGGLRCAGNGMF